MKNKGLPMWDFVQWLNTPFKDAREVIVTIGVIVVVALVFVALLMYFVPTSTEIYQSTYDDCMAHENMTKNVCHEIALERVGD